MPELEKLVPETRIYALTPDHLLIADMLHRGSTTRDICERMGISPAALGSLKTTPDFHAYLTELRRETLSLARNRIESETLNSIERIIDIRDNAPNPRLQFDASRDILDRAGLKAPERLEVRQELGVTSDLADLLRSILQETREVDAITVTEVRVLPERAETAELTSGG